MGGQAMTHSINGKPVPACGEECSCPSLADERSPIATETQMYANLRDAVKLLNELVERNKLHLNETEAELLWRLRFVTRIEPS